MSKVRFYLPEYVCLRAVDGKVTLTDAVEMFLESVPDEDYLKFACPGHEVLFESPDENGNEQYEARLMAFFVAMLDGFTQTDTPHKPPLTFPILRSAPDSK